MFCLKLNNIRVMRQKYMFEENYTHTDAYCCLSGGDTDTVPFARIRICNRTDSYLTSLCVLFFNSYLHK